MKKEKIDNAIRELKDGNAFIVVTHYIPNSAFCSSEYLNEEAQRLRGLGCLIYIQSRPKTDKKPRKYIPKKENLDAVIPRRVLRKLTDDEIQIWEEIKNKVPTELTHDEKGWLLFFEYITKRIVKMNVQ